MIGNHFHAAIEKVKVDSPCHEQFIFWMNSVQGEGKANSKDQQYLSYQCRGSREVHVFARLVRTFTVFDVNLAEVDPLICCLYFSC